MNIHIIVSIIQKSYVHVMYITCNIHVTYMYMYMYCTCVNVFMEDLGMPVVNEVHILCTG